MDQCKPLLLTTYVTGCPLKRETRIRSSHLAWRAISLPGLCSRCLEMFRECHSLHDEEVGRGLHSSTFQLNLSRFSHKIQLQHPLSTA